MLTVIKIDSWQTCPQNSKNCDKININMYYKSKNNFEKIIEKAGAKIIKIEIKVIQNQKLLINMTNELTIKTSVCKDISFFNSRSKKHFL